MSQLEQELAALQRMSSAQLRAEWGRVIKTLPPPVSPDLLARGIAYHLQERRHGGLPSATRRQIERAGREVTDGRPSRDGPDLKPGSRLSREWGGRTHNVLVLGDGFLFEERRYRSLSQIANAITGTNWSGPRFFGLRNARASRNPETVRG